MYIYSRWLGSPTHHWLWNLHTGPQAMLILCLSTLPPASGTLISKWHAKFTLLWKEDFGSAAVCWCWSSVFSEVHSQCNHLPGNLRALHASFCWQALWRCWFSFSSRTWHLPTLPKIPKAGSMTTVLLCLIGQQTHMACIIKTKMRDTWTNNADDLKAAVKATWASITPEQCYRLIASMLCCTDVVIHAKGGKTKYLVHRINILFKSLTFLFKISFFYWSFVVF